MRTVLVCVRTPLVAHNVAAMAARLGLSAAVRTAASEPEAMLRLAERACDVVLADTCLARPDPAAFVRRVLARAPGAAVLLIGAEDRATAAAALAAGARGLVQADPGDLISGVVKAMLLLAAPPRTRRPGLLPGAGGSAASTPAVPGPAVPTPAAQVPPAAPAAPAAGEAGIGEGRTDQGESGGSGGAEPPAVVPAQRGDDAVDAPTAADPGAAATGAAATGTATTGAAGGGEAPALSRAPEARLGWVADHPGPGPARRGDTVVPGAPGRPAAAGSGGLLGGVRRLGGSGQSTGPVPHPASAGAAQRVTLTEREMQVLIGMADGKSNAEIGRELFVSEDTVKTHARRLFRKLGARDRAHAVAAGFRAGLVA